MTPIRFSKPDAPLWVLVAVLLLSAFGCAAPQDDGEATAGTPADPPAGEQIVNVYSARHYDRDDLIYAAFEAKTGIKVRRVEGESAAMLERLSREGEASPADLYFAVDAGRLALAESRDIFEPVESEILASRIPASLRHPDNLWFGFTKRARVIVYAKDRVDPSEIATYEDLADPKWRDRVLSRSSSNIYSQSLMASIIAAAGEEAAEAWCEGFVANFARTPQGGDRDQIRAVAAGEADLAIANTYYLAQMMAADDTPADQEAAAKVGVIFPNQDDRGTHVNISGAGLVKNAPNRANALTLLEFLTDPEAQSVFAGGNKEYPVVEGYDSVPELVSFGEFREDEINASLFGGASQQALRVMDRCGWR